MSLLALSLQMPSPSLPSPLRQVRASQTWLQPAPAHRARWSWSSPGALLRRKLPRVRSGIDKGTPRTQVASLISLRGHWTASCRGACCATGRCGCRRLVELLLRGGFRPARLSQWTAPPGISSRVHRRRRGVQKNYVTRSAVLSPLPPASALPSVACRPVGCNLTQGFADRVPYRGGMGPSRGVRDLL